MAKGTEDENYRCMFLLIAETGMEGYGMIPFTRILGTMGVEEA